MNPYRLLLLAFPRRVRDEFGRDMELLFEEQLRSARERGGSRIALWWMAAVDAIVNGLGERLDRVRPVARSGRSAFRRWRWWMAAIVQDLRYARRLFTKQRATTTMAVVTLALGIGATTAIFSAVDALLLRPLPYPDPHELVMVWEKRPTEGVLDNVVAPADYVDWERMNTTFASIAALTPSTAVLTGAGEPVRLPAAAVSPAFFDVLRIQPALGRSFRQDESVVGRHAVVVLGHPLWRDRFGLDRSIVGRKIQLNGAPHEVVGVLPESFTFPNSNTQIWAPLPLRGTGRTLSRALHQFWVYARLKPGVGLNEARADMDRVAALLSEQYPDTNRNHGAWVSPLADEVREPVRGGLWILFGAVAFVLMIACVNVANLLLARAASRRKEIAIRIAVGASRTRIAGQMITESALLGILGGAAGLIVAYWGIRLVPQLAPITMAFRGQRGMGLPISGLESIGLDARVLAFAFVLSLFTGLLFGTLPAWALAGQDVNDELKRGGWSGAVVKRRLRVGLVISEIALASLLLVGAGLTWRSFHALLTDDSGIHTGGVLTAFITLPGARYGGNEKQLAAFEEIERRFAAIPEVRAVGATNFLPLGGMDGRRGVGIEGREAEPDGPTRAHPRSVTPGYFSAMGIRVTGGRAFTDRDRANTPLVAIVNDTMARRYWPGQSPVGRRIRLGGTEDWREVVGVVFDVRHWGLDRPVNPELYLPLAQMPSGFLTFVIATDGDPSVLAPAVREQLRAIDPELPLSRVLTMEQVAAQSVESRAATMRLLAIFGIVSLVLAAAGIYGVMTHLVASRSGEIGVRLTLGARPADVRRMILREGATQAAAGLAIGIAGGVLLMRAFRAMLHGISPADPITLASVAVALLATALLACYVPARRAMRVDPVEVLKQ
jgi:putative ABC transport system permease protein